MAAKIRIRPIPASLQFKSAVQEQVKSVVAELRPTPYELYPKAERYIHAEVIKGVQAGTVQSERDARTAAAALIAAGAEVSRSNRLGIKDLKRGWNMLAPGNCPPHNCFFRTVITREAEVASQLPMYDALAKGL